MDIFSGLLIKSVHPFKKISARVKVLNITLIIRNNPLKRMYSLILPYAGHKGNTIIKTMNNSLKRILPNNVKTRVTYTGQKLGTKFQNKDKTKDQHKHDLVYYSKCPEPTYNEDYLGETGKRIIERSADHCGKDK